MKKNAFYAQSGGVTSVINATASALILESKKYEELLLDKDHYNTFELISHPEKDFRNHGHNKIFHYFFLILIGLISLKIIFFYENKKNNYSKFSFIFLLIIFVQILNSYLIYLINSKMFFNLNLYYVIMLIFSSFILYYTFRDIR